MDLRTLLLNIDLLLLDLNLQRNVELRDLSGADLHIILNEDGESLRVSGYRVVARREIAEFVIAVVTRLGGMGLAARLDDGDGGVGHDRTRGIDDLPA